MFFIHTVKDMLSWLRLLLFLSFKLCRSTQFKVNFAKFELKLNK